MPFANVSNGGVKVTDVSKGMSSDAQGARLMFGTLALVNDHFLEMVRTETHRGLEGRALAGFSTGGRVYGFSTVKEEGAAAVADVKDEGGTAVAEVKTEVSEATDEVKGTVRQSADEVRDRAADDRP